ncbi:hypothetical protein ACFQO1_11550 [Jejudonia soesokkakensis]|uniref:YhhN-like protein n=1 Tax=Jejudonia soesokkakensis TaxID=1323432 RepID=A0ABW2MWS4_9FLAO
MGTRVTRNVFSLLNIAILLIIINVVVIYALDIIFSRWIRVISMLIFLTLLLFKRNFTNNFISIALFFLLLRDICIINYEVPIFRTISFFGTIGAYLVITYFILRRLKLFVFSPKIILFTIGLVALNIFNVYYLSDIVIPVLDNSLQLILFFLQSAIILFMALFAYTYFETYSGKRPLFYLYFVFAFILSDLAGLAAYFFGLEEAYYFERIFYLAGVGLLVYFVANFAQVEEHPSELVTEKILL